MSSEDIEITVNITAGDTSGIDLIDSAMSKASSRMATESLRADTEMARSNYMANTQIQTQTLTVQDAITASTLNMEENRIRAKSEMSQANALANQQIESQTMSVQDAIAQSSQNMAQMNEEADMAMLNANTSATQQMVSNEADLNSAYQSALDAQMGFTNEMEGGSLSLRRMGWDMMLLARSMNFFGTALGIQTNPAFHEFYTVLMGVAFAMRLIMVIGDMPAIFSTIAGSLGPLTTAFSGLSAAMADAAFWENILTFGAVALAAVATIGLFTALQSMQPKAPSMQGGGMVQQTGLHLLHEGEAVIPKSIVQMGNSGASSNSIQKETTTNTNTIQKSSPTGVGTTQGNGTNYTYINIDMKTGPISSNVDTENMLEEMTSRLALESRRRIGH